MICPQCRLENRDAAKFCRRCGVKLEIICRKCQALLTPDSVFCDECGTKVAGIAAIVPSIDEKLIKIQKYLPKGITDRILAQKDRIEGERKQVTVMFCDMAGFTPLLEQMDPESAYGIVDQVYELLIHKVHAYDGTVNEMTGDGIMALFGAPIALEDAPQRAIRSAIAIHREMARFSEKTGRNIEGIPSLKMRIGLHTGLVVVGAVGNDLRVEFKAVGDTVNLASRMEGLAEPGTTYVTESTFKLTEGLFRFETIGEKSVKGRTTPVKVYRAIAPSSSRTRFDVSTERGLTPFVGRDREIELLLDGLDRCKTGRGQAISIVADAGMGKSRILYEFRKAVANENVTFLEGTCLSFSRAIVYHPIIDILKANFDIRHGDSGLQIINKVKSGLKELRTDQTATLPYLLDLLSVKDGVAESVPLSPEAKKYRIFEALKQIVLNGSKLRPLVLAFENLHWIDKSSEEALKVLLDSVSGARVYLIFTYRPEFVHTWGGRSYHSQINLNRLSNRETLMMITHLLRTEAYDQQIKSLVLEKTEGVPFFIEELINSLKDQNVIIKKKNAYVLSKDTRKAILPATIHDVIMARIDSLPDGAKELLQTGSVAGREFSHQLIETVTELSKDELLAHLSALKDSELIYDRGIYPRTSYIFKHALTQEVAYGNMLKKKRTQLHLKIGKALEKNCGDRLEECFEFLAHHCMLGEDWQRAFKFSQDAGLKAYSHSAYEQSQKYFEDALKALAKLPRNKSRIEQKIDLLFHMRSPLVSLGRHSEWGEWIRIAEPLAREIGDDARLANVLNYLSSLHWINGQHPESIELGKKALVYAEKAGHFSIQTATMMHLGIYFFNVGDYTKQIAIHQKVRDRLQGEAAYEQHGLASLPGALSRSMLALGLAELGRFDQISEIGKEALKIAEKVRNALTLAFVYNFLAMSFLRRGEFGPAISYLEKYNDACQFFEVRSMHSVAVGSLAYAYMLAGEPKRALGELEEATKEENLRASFWPAHSMIILSDVYRAAGDMVKAAEAAAGAMEISKKRAERGFEAWAMLVMAAIEYCKGTPEEAITWYRRAHQLASDLLMRPLLAHCHRGLSNAYLSLGNVKQSAAEDKAAIEMYRRMGMNYWLSEKESKGDAPGAVQ